MSIFDFLFRKNKVADSPSVNSSPKDTKQLDLSKVQLDQIIAFMKDNYSKPVVRIHAEKAEHMGLTDSKFGGYPYWETGREFPQNASGNQLILLTQINFGLEHLADSLLPAQGILQFFIDTDDLNGLDLDHPTSQEGFRVVYHPVIDTSITEADVIASGIRANTALVQKEEYFPFYQEYRLSFEAGMDTLPSCDVDEYNNAMILAMQSLFGIQIGSDVYHYFSDDAYEYLEQQLSVWGHKLLGYPDFTQWDPRNEEKKVQYDTLLLQMDSDVTDILWGDSGVANFFINSEALKKLDFSQILYNWDCY